MADTQCPISVMYFTRDVKRSIAFYRDVLGFTCKETWPDENHPKWANLMLGNQSIMFSTHMEEAQVRELCSKDPDNLKYMLGLSADFARNKPGAGVVVYLMVPDIDAYHAELRRRGVDAPAPRDQFYGLRELPVDDPDGYRLLFYQPIQITACQSCGMPLSAPKPGQMYCAYCTDERGQLRPWEQVFEGTVTGYFMAMHKMERAAAEAAARAHLAAMPAWVHRFQQERAEAVAAPRKATTTRTVTLRATKARKPAPRAKAKATPARRGRKPAARRR